MASSSTRGSFEWIGVRSRINVVCALTKASGIISVDAWIAAKAPVNWVAALRVLPMTTAKLLRQRSGYLFSWDGLQGARRRLNWPRRAVKSMADVGLGSHQSDVRQGLDAGDANIVLQAVPKQSRTSQRFRGHQLAKTEEARKLIQVGIHDTARLPVPTRIPPGRPRIGSMLRRAFRET